MMLLGLVVLGIASLYPMQVASIRSLVMQGLVEVPLRAEIMGLVTLLQPFVLSMVALGTGQYLSKKVGLRSLISQGKWRTKKGFVPATLSGLGLGAGFVGFDQVLEPWLPFLGETVRPDLYGLVVGILYGGIVEEVLLRFGLMTVFVYFLTKKGKRRKPKKYITAILISALLFALGHYGATSALTEMTPLVWTRMLLLNGSGGVVFGLLYWKHHLEAAMVGHMTTHVGMFVTNYLLYMIGS